MKRTSRMSIAIMGKENNMDDADSSVPPVMRAP
jgi:hypothetical protein